MQQRAPHSDPTHSPVFWPGEHGASPILTNSATQAEPTQIDNVEILSPWAGLPPEQVLRRAGKTFAFATRFFPRPVRSDIASLYAFCRTADDLADDEGTPAAARLRALDHFERRFLSDVQAGRDGSESAILFHRHGIPVAYAQDLITGMRTDILGQQFGSFRDLRLYCYRVASTVGLMLCHVWGVKDAQALRQAESLGVAMQLTNISRDVGEDFQRGRIYLPTEWTERASLRPQDLAAGTVSEPLKAVLEKGMQTAESFYNEGLQGVPALPAFARFPVQLAAVLYRDIHTSIRKIDYDVLTRRARTTVLRKAWLGMRLYFSV